jgi:MFS family permease
MAEEARKINEAANAAIDMERGDPPTLERWSKVLQRDYKQFNQPAVRAALTAGIGVVVFQQITGQPSVLYYANTLFESIGVTGAASIGVSVFKLLMTLGTTITVDKYGRKLLLNIGCSIMLVALALLAILFALPTTDTTQVFILIALVLYIGGYQLGFGPIAWLFISEIFPLEVRGKAVSLAVITNFFWNVVTSLIFPTEVSLIGESATFVIYGVILVFGMIFINRFVPETKGLTLEDITRLFEGQAAEEERRLQEERNSSPEDVNSPLIETTEEGRKEENTQMAI